MAGTSSVMQSSIATTCTGRQRSRNLARYLVVAVQGQHLMASQVDS